MMTRTAKNTIPPDFIHSGLVLSHDWIAGCQNNVNNICETIGAQSAPYACIEEKKTPFLDALSSAKVNAGILLGILASIAGFVLKKRAESAEKSDGNGEELTDGLLSEDEKDSSRDTNLILDRFEARLSALEMERGSQF